jgi:hypothetical protein
MAERGTPLRVSRPMTVNSPSISRARWLDGRFGRLRKSLRPMLVGTPRVRSILAAQQLRPYRRLPRPQ